MEGKVIAFKPRRLELEYYGTDGKQPKVIFTEKDGTYAHTFNEFIMIGENAQGEIQAVNCDFKKLCDSIEFLLGLAMSGYHTEYDQARLAELIKNVPNVR